ILEDQHTVLVDIQVRIVNSCLVVVDGGEHDGLAAMLHQRRCSRRWFYHRAIRYEIAAQHHDAATFDEGIVALANNVGIEILDPVECFTKRLAACGHHGKVEQILDFSLHGRYAACIAELFHQILSGWHNVCQCRHEAPGVVP